MTNCNSAAFNCVRVVFTTGPFRLLARGSHLRPEPLLWNVSGRSRINTDACRHCQTQEESRGIRHKLSGTLNVMV